MSSEPSDATGAGAAARHLALAARPRRPWFLIAAALLLAVLSGTLWSRWRDTRMHAEQLEAELKGVYAEAEMLRTEAVRAQQRIAQLERELRGAAANTKAGDKPASPSPDPR
ncbi:MAG TPA: hypothetical protein VEL75_09480 [Candidatus Methylomirabilis sp.]|nr:hypothetical protein [Candidatus Methylomirabilis sp.]